MGMIRLLPTSVYNQIYAGQMVENAASVVKELVENSIDAGSSRVEINVTGDLGTDCIEVADNGCGIDASDVDLLFLKHSNH